MPAAADVPYVAVIGASEATPEQERAAEAVGRELAVAGAVVITGGGRGVMAAASRGADSVGGIVVGILPSSDRRTANPWVGVALATGLGELRNGLIVRAADAAVAVGGAYGTLSEIGLALSAQTPVVGLGTWPIDGVEVAESPQVAARRGLELARGAHGQVQGRA